MKVLESWATTAPTRDIELTYLSFPATSEVASKRIVSSASATAFDAATATIDTVDWVSDSTSSTNTTRATIELTRKGNSITVNRFGLIKGKIAILYKPRHAIVFQYMDIFATFISGFGYACSVQLMERHLRCEKFLNWWMAFQKRNKIRNAIIKALDNQWQWVDFPREGEWEVGMEMGCWWITVIK